MEPVLAAGATVVGARCATAAGKARTAAVGVCMRKFLMICYGVLRTRTPFDPQWSVKMTG
jgi:hypothetical protein